MIITIPGECPTSWNEFYSGRHWRIRRNEAERVHQMVRANLDPNMPVYQLPVHIHVRAYFPNKRKQLDPDNIAAKLYIDGLCGWLIADDTAQFVASVTTSSHLDRENHRVEIEITEAAQ